VQDSRDARLGLVAGDDHGGVGDPASAVNFDASPEGHALRFDNAGNLVGVTILNAKWLLENEGGVVITFPERVEVGPDTLEQALAVA
jgi:hypothetical protein